MASEFNIGIQTAASNNLRLSKRKTMKRASLDDLDKSLFIRVSQKLAQGVPLSIHMLVEKVKVFNNALGSSLDCNANWGWLHHFKAS